MDTPLTRSRNDRMIAGVMGGLARRWGWNSTLLRIIFVLVSVLSAAFPGIVVYLIAWLVMPEEAAERIARRLAGCRPRC